MVIGEASDTLIEQLVVQCAQGDAVVDLIWPGHGMPPDVRCLHSDRRGVYLRPGYCHTYPRSYAITFRHTYKSSDTHPYIDANHTTNT